MGLPQSVIIPESRQYSLFVTLKLIDMQANARDVAKVLSGMPDLVGEVGCLDADAGLTAGVAFGPEFWAMVTPVAGPPGLHAFLPLGEGALTAPATGGDVLIHINSARVDFNYECFARLWRLLKGKAAVMEEVAAFRYLDARDLTGFIDGTENPQGEERADVALIGDDAADFAGGSFVMTQRYVHDLDKWETLSQAEQEGAVGRTKQDSVELEDEERPETAHISRVVIEADGEELEIVRHSLPYGTVAGEKGLFFIAYNKNLDTFEKMLSRMFGVSGDGLHDRLMDYTRPVTGAFFFTPSETMLRSLG